MLKTAGRISALFALLVSYGSAQSTDGCTFMPVQIQQDLTYVFALNNAGTIVGEFVPSSAQSCHSEAGFILKNGSVTCLVWPGSFQTSANAINDAGVVAGAYTLQTFGPEKGFEWNEGKFTELNYPGSILTAATGINAHATIVGNYQDSRGAFHGFSYADGKYTAINYPGAASTQASQINNAGVIVGYYTDSSNVEHGFEDVNGTFAVIDYPGATNTSPSAINNNGIVVGAYYNGDFSQYHGFAWKNGEFKTISDPVDVDQTTVNGINDHAELIGSLGNSSGGFKATGCILP